MEFLYVPCANHRNKLLYKLKLNLKLKLEINKSLNFHPVKFNIFMKNLVLWVYNTTSSDGMACHGNLT